MIGSEKIGGVPRLALGGQRSGRRLAGAAAPVADLPMLAEDVERIGATVFAPAP
jgi:hypothetical protein